MTYYSYYDLPFGKMLIAETNGAINEIFFSETDAGFLGIHEETALLREAYRQLKEYFYGKRKNFSLPLAARGTDFQKQVWRAMRAIPYGETRSYKQIAAQLGNEKASRAVGQAANRNPIAIVTPCHRVIGADGSLTGFGGGIELKKKLLNLEKHS